ncbi:MAG: hypothetical protein BJ554DRAFT_7665, partial [Olpidium bornovanus]
IGNLRERRRRLPHIPLAVHSDCRGADSACNEPDHDYSSALGLAALFRVDLFGRSSAVRTRKASQSRAPEFHGEHPGQRWANPDRGHRSAHSRMGRESEIGDSHLIRVINCVFKDGDGLNEVVLGRTDRVLHAFRLQPLSARAPTPRTSRNAPSGPEEFSSWHPNISKQQYTTRTQQPSAPPKSAAGKSGASAQSDSPSKRSQLLAARAANPFPLSQEDNGAVNRGAPRTMGASLGAEEIRKWQVHGQVGSLAIAKNHETGSPLLLVSQPGGTFVVIDKDGNRSVDPRMDHEAAGGSRRECV